MSEVDLQRLENYRSQVRKRKIEYRNLTYIPEFNEVSSHLHLVPVYC